MPLVYTKFNTYYVDLLKAVKSSSQCRKAIKTHYREFDHTSHRYLDSLAERASAFFTAFGEDPAALSADEHQGTLFGDDLPLSSLRAAKDQLSEHALTQYCFVFAVLLRQRELGDEVVEDVWERMRKSKDDPSALDGIEDEVVRKLAANVAPVAPEIPKAMADALRTLENTKIGKLAKSITEELKLEDVAGKGMQDPAMLGNLIGKVGSVMQKSLTNGDLNLQDVMSEVGTMASALPSLLGGGGADNPMGDMLKNMMGMFGGQKPPQQQPHRPNTARSNVRERLAARLKDRQESTD